MVQHKHGISLYYAVKEKILNRITDGFYPVGSQLPTEANLCDEFNVSRTTIRVALQQLELEGKIKKVQGKGTFVSSPKFKENISQNIKSFSEQMKEAGLSSYSKVLNLEIVPATTKLAHDLEINADDPVIKLIRLRFAEKLPYQYSISYVPWKIAPGLINDDCSHSLFELLREKYHVDTHKSVESIQPILPSKTVCELLEINKNTASFELESYTYTAEETLIEYSNTIVRGDYAKFVTERYYDN
ncbi:GntR family transcriptional regulator [Gracilibacillus timonensis]|uniref:GntR family transcriptional regulator n=1 Tax=Gracilibacillus timonensis TaxID=1816696 RepID=UPI00082546C5|nr:GntR family transcriptional regulator [Gracilibacillus timonensis]